MTSMNERGFTLIELLVSIFVFSIASVGFYQVLFSSTAAVSTAQDVVAVSEEARLGFNRMVRDARESNEVFAPSATSFTVKIDFNADGNIVPSPTEGAALGNFEQLTFTFNPAATPGNGNVTVSGGGLSEMLMRGVDCVRKTNGTCHDVFVYGSSRLEYDTSGDGRASASEIMTALGVSTFTQQVLDEIDIVEFALTVHVGDSVETFYAEAQLRNQR